MGFMDVVSGKVKEKVKEYKENQEIREQKREQLQERYEKSGLVSTIIYCLCCLSGYLPSENGERSDELAWIFKQQGMDDDRCRTLIISEEGILFLWYRFVTVRDHEGKHTEREILGKWGITFENEGFAPLDKVVFEEVSFGKVDVVQAFTRAFMKVFTETFPDVSDMGTPSYKDYSMIFGSGKTGYAISYKAQEKQWKTII